MLASPPHTAKIPSYITTADELVNNNIKEIPTLIHPIFPKVGVIAVAGSSDTGKSSLLRQLAMEIVSGKETFLRFPINAKHRSVLYISTEDDYNALSCTLKMQNTTSSSGQTFKGLRFIFDTTHILAKVESELEREPVDLIIVDAFSDLYGHDMNRANEVRTYIQNFSNLAIEHQCLLVFLHHTGKKTEDNPPSKNNMLGSQGFEAKMRVVVELRKDFNDLSGARRHFCIVKGNYLAETFKNRSYVLNFTNTLTFNNTGSRVAFEELAPQNNGRGRDQAAVARALELRAEGNTIAQIHENMESEGFSQSESAIGKYVRGIPRG